VIDADSEVVNPVLKPPPPVIVANPVAVPDSVNVSRPLPM
jgi:hypothetical protein